MSLDIVSRHPLNDSGWVRWIDPVDVLSTYETSRVGGLVDAASRYAATGHYAFGFLTYEAGSAFDEHFVTLQKGRGLPLAWFAIFRTFEAFDFHADFAPVASWEPSITREAYRDKIAAIKELIACGETYQVNFTFPLITRDPLSMRNLFARLYQAQPTPYAAYIETDAFSLASVSPELFFRLDGDRIECQPMKGTCPRGPYPAIDSERANQLRDSKKNRAENLMIVDMIRNDLGRIARPGSVKANRLFEVSAWPTLWQMTSTVEARTDQSLRDIVAAIFPGASITGAPKLHTSSIIARLEGEARGIYTGAIGWIGPGRKASFSIAIRTATQLRNEARSMYGIGSGIVWDSEAESEYEECLLKARILTSPAGEPYDLLETMRWEPAGGILLKELHLERMKSSADFLGYPWSEAGIGSALDVFNDHSSTSPMMVRLLLNRKGQFRIESKPLNQPGHFSAPTEAPRMTARVDTFRQPIESLLLYHKTTNRRIYEEAGKRHPDVEEVLLVNHREELMEFTNGNVVVARNGHYLTPTVESGLLAGTFRRQLLEQGIIREAPIPLASLSTGDTLYFINSVRGWRRVDLAG